MRFNPKRLFKNILMIICVFLLLWFFVSYIDIVIHNLNGGSTWDDNIIEYIKKIKFIIENITKK